MPKFLEVSDTIAAKTAINAEHYVSAVDYGVAGNGTTDDTAALQTWINHLVANHRIGWLPNGTYKITAGLQAAAGYGWGIVGESWGYTVIKQFTDNTPILLVGDDTEASHSVTLQNLFLTYNTAQPVTNTNANCIVFEGKHTGDKSSVYWGRFRGLRLWNGYYGMKTVADSIQPWGSEFDDITCRYMSGGFYDGTGSADSGTPCNQWGRLTLFCDDAVGPMFKSWSTSSTSISTLEFLLGKNCQLITTKSGFQAHIGNITWEAGDWDTSGNNKPFIELGNPANVHIENIVIAGGSGTQMSPTSNFIALIGTSGPNTENTKINVGLIQATGTFGADAGKVYAVSGAVGRTYIREVVLPAGIGLQNTGGSVTGDRVHVQSWVNDSVSADKGDADYTVTLSDPNVVVFQTAFTAQRTITLPAKSGNNLCAGLYYELVFDGAINGSNTAVIKEGSNTLRTQTVDKVKLRYMWRRQNTTGQWVLTGITDLAGNVAKSADVQVFTSSGTWTKPAGATAVTVRCVGPGGGGGAGALGASGTALSGGGAGSGGGMSEQTFDADDLTSTVTVTIGTGGAGGAGQTSSDTAGANGAAGSNNTTFGAFLFAGRGAGGGGGGLAAAGAGGGSATSGFSLGMITGGSGAAGSATGAAGGNAAWVPAAPGGGGGGGVTTAPAANAGGLGGRSYTNFSAAGTAGSAANGGNGVDSAVRGPGSGGGGGGASTSGNGYDGGDGGDYGAGGGGGGAALNGNTSGAGGAGGDGVCIVTSYF